MGADQQIDWRQAAASVLAWWDEAGVDLLVDDAPRDWLAPPSVSAPTHPVALAAEPSPDLLPATLEAFTAWRNGALAPEHSLPGAWVAATGPAAARLMVLVDCPDRGDEQEGLLSGPAGRLFDRMLAAIGLTRETVCLAAVCGKRPIAGRVPGDLAERLAGCAQRHVSLIAPERLLLLGDAASRAILGSGVTAARAGLRSFNHDRGETGVVASYHPRLLIDRPALKAAAWADLQALTKGWNP